MNWFIPFNKLTPEQQKLVGLSTESNRVMFGGPGSGKTIILLHRAYYLHKAKHIPIDKIHIFVYNNTLLSFIQSGLIALGLDPAMASTLDSWCYHYYQAHIGKKIPRILASSNPDFHEIRMQTYQKICLMDSSPQYQAVMVDEGQDLDEICYKIFLKISRHVTVACDYNQQIYEITETQDSLIRLLNAQNNHSTLNRLVRCTRGVANIAEAFISNINQKQEFRNQVDLIERRDQIPAFQIAPYNSRESSELMKQIRMRVNDGDSVGIVFPTNRTLFGFVKAAVKEGIEIETPTKTKFSKAHDFNNLTPKAFTIFGIKGLTFDVVLIPFLQHRFYAQMNADRLLKSLFVAVTRAVHWVYFSSTKEIFPNRDVFNDLKHTKLLEYHVIPSDQTDIFEMLGNNETQGTDFLNDEEDSSDDFSDLL
jgi:superfamily I DNA/RNA helicase